MSIVVADLHGDVEKARAFLAYRPDQVHVALGDYLDSYTEPVERQQECLKLLMDSDSVLLLGNHECHYLKYPLFQFAGYNSVNAPLFQDILEANIPRFRVAYAADGWLCTHAGVKSDFTEDVHDVEVLANIFNRAWDSYLVNRLVDHQAQYFYQSIFSFNFRIYVEGNLLPTNIGQIFGHCAFSRPIVEPEYIALDTTDNSNSCWLYDTETNELVQLPLEPKPGRVRFQGGRGCSHDLCNW
jgi:hypothetical protein